MNSLTKWSVDRLQVVTISIPVGGAGASPASVELSRLQAQDFIAASVELDLNNVPGGTALSADQQSSLLREALTRAAQIQGDIGLNAEGFKNVELPS